MGFFTTRNHTRSVPHVDSKSEIDDSLRSDADTLSLEARNEKEVQDNPNQITEDAALGVKKAEAAAIVWSKNVVYCTYAW